MTRWRCTVCDYIYEGAQPPECCPVCGVGPERFVAVGHSLRGLIKEMSEAFVLHAVVSHYPNGALPAALLFLGLFALSGEPSLEQAVFYMVALCTAVIPVALVSGIYDWRTRFGGRRAAVFYRKIVLGGLLQMLGLLATGMRLLHPQLMHEAGWMRWGYLGTLVGMLACTVMLGHYGGKLVFQWKSRR